MADTPKVEPAMTPDEWRDGLELVHGAEAPIPYAAFAIVTDFTEQSCDYVEGGRARQMDRHAVAALALYGQPFGFTRADVNELRRHVMAYYRDADTGLFFQVLADRIEALLPPEATVDPGR